MRSHPRARRILKWTGVCLCTLIVAAWGVSLRKQLGFHSRYWYAAIYRSSLTVGRPASGRGWYVWQDSPRGASDYGFKWPTIATWGRPGARLIHISVPLWLPLLAVAIPMAILFYRDRRRILPGYCRECGYNLTGNQSGVCPECGSGL